MKIITAKEASKPLTKKQKEHLADCERSYRRGYVQGFSQGMDDVKVSQGNPLWMKVAKFFDDKLMKWRYGKKPFDKKFDTLEFPPEYSSYRNEV